jgi:hypothetical protein
VPLSRISCDLLAFWAKCTQQALDDDDEDENEMPIGVANQGPRLGAFISVQNASGTKSH